MKRRYFACALTGLLLAAVAAPGAAVTYTYRIPSNGLLASGAGGAGTGGAGTSPIASIFLGSGLVASGGGTPTFLTEADGSLWVTGASTFGQRGNGTVGSSAAFTKIGTFGLKMAVGRDHTALILANGTLLTSGDNSRGQLGTNNTTSRTTFGPALTEGGAAMASVVDVSATYYATFALKSDGTLWATGTNTNYNLGTGDNATHLGFVQVLTGVTSVKASANHTLAQKTDGSIWGSSVDNVALGRASSAYTFQPLTGTGVLDYAAGGDFSAYLSPGSTIVTTTGYNAHGQLSTGDTSTRYSWGYTPVSGVVKLAAGEQHLLALRGDGTLYASGYNAYGQLGNGTTTDVHGFVQVLTGVQSISAGSHRSVATKTDGSVWVTGRNDDGGLGIAGGANVLTWTKLTAP